MSEKPAPVYECDDVVCNFEHWDRLEMWEHLVRAHDKGSMESWDIVFKSRAKRSKIWILKKIPPPEPKKIDKRTYRGETV